MKFSKQLNYLSIKRWRSYYIDYFKLKKAIKRIFKPFLNARFQTVKATPLGVSNTNRTLLRNYNLFLKPQNEEVHTRILSRSSSQEMFSISATSPTINAGFTGSIDDVDSSNDSNHEATDSTDDPEARYSSSRRAISKLDSNDQQLLQRGIEEWRQLYFAEVKKVRDFALEAIQEFEGELADIDTKIAQSPVSRGMALDIKRDYLALSVDATELLDFLTINKEGFRKILKKLLKVVSWCPTTGDTLLAGQTEKRVSYVSKEHDEMMEFTKSTFGSFPSVSDMISSLHASYVETFARGRFAGGGDEAAALAIQTMRTSEQTQLELDLMHEIQASTSAQVSWTKNTILGEFNEYQNKAQMAGVHSVIHGMDHHLDTYSTEDAEEDGPSTALIAKSDQSAEPKKLYFKVKWVFVIIALVVFIVMGVFPWPANIAREMRCLGLLCWASILWGFDAIPSHVTAMSVPVLATFLNLMNKSFKESANILIQSTISSTPYLAIGGFSIARAMKDCGLDVYIANALLRFKIARKPAVFILIAVVLEFLLTMVISNISSTVLIVSLILPVLRELPADSKFSKGLLMSIAMSGNLAGMVSPLASPQSLVGIEAINDILPEGKSLSFAKWTGAALPVSIVSTLLMYLLVFCFYRMDIKTVPFTPSKLTCLTFKQVVVALFSLVTVVFWFILPYCPWLGNEGIIGLIPFFIAFGFNLVPRTDIAELPWTMILLVMGGGALGESIKLSGLLELISKLFGSGFESLHSFVQMVILSAVVGFVSIFVSHTVAAIVLIPIVGSILGANTQAGLIMMACALEISPPMLLAVASFPNMCCYAIEDSHRKSYLTNKDFLLYGGTVTLVSYALIISIFWGTGLLMKL